MPQFDWYVIRNIMYYNDHTCILLLFTGPISLGNVISEQKFGLASRPSVKCNICHQVNNVTTSEQHRTGTRGPKAYDTNTRLASASLDNGIGFSRVNSILSALEIPSITRSTYKKRKEKLDKPQNWWQENLVRKC